MTPLRYGVKYVTARERAGGRRVLECTPSGFASGTPFWYARRDLETLWANAERLFDGEHAALAYRCAFPRCVGTFIEVTPYD